jgi:protein required for attachment to host cells
VTIRTIVANRSCAWVFECEDSTTDWTFVKLISDPAGRISGREIDTDRPGRSFDSTGKGRHAMGTVQDPRTHAAVVFAKDIAGLLEKDRMQGSFQELVLVGAPAFLGQLRNSLSDATADLVSASYDKDLAGLEEQEIVRRIAELRPK